MVCSNVEIAFLVLLVGALITGLARSCRPAGWLAVGFIGAATILVWTDGLSVLLSGRTCTSFIAPLPGFGSQLAVSLDTLGAAFLLLISGVSLVATVYSVGYMGIYKRECPARFYSLLQLFVAGMMGVVCVADWLFFIVFWELMTLTSYFLITFERSNPAVVRAGFKYFVMTHVATAGLIFTAVVLWRTTGSFAFDAHKSGLALMSGPLRNTLLAFYLIAFATKAGIFPLGDWLPDAHPAAPSGVSAILSGVMIKLGAYGVLRVFWGMLPDVGSQTEVMTWGVIIASLGAISALVGGLTAMKENDSKRLLAFSSISQTGYIFLALGIGITFAGTPALSSLALLGFLGAGFHILSDAVYKSLLFMNAGSMLYSTGTTDLNKVGGLSSVMPLAAAAGLVGILSLSGLPPTNGFASKWVIYQSTIAGGLQFAPFVLTAVVAFFVGMVTLAYSLKFYGLAFLGPPVSEVDEPRPIPGTMTFAQVFMAVVCLVIGLSPFWAIRLIGSISGIDVSNTFATAPAGGLVTLARDGAVPAFWSPVVFFGVLVLCFALAEIVRAAGRAQQRAVPHWYGGEEHLDDEVRYRANGLYAPFNDIFADIYPSMSIPRLPSIKKLRSVLDLDGWLYGPLVGAGGRLVDRVSRSHVGIPQLYVVWQIAGMIIVVTLLFLIIR